MAEKNEIKTTDYILIFVGNHQQKQKDDSLKYFSWKYELRRDRKISRLIVQEFTIKDEERIDKGNAIKFEDIYCKLTRHQAREFVRNLKS